MKFRASILKRMYYAHCVPLQLYSINNNYASLLCLLLLCSLTGRPSLHSHTVPDKSCVHPTLCPRIKENSVWRGAHGLCEKMTLSDRTAVCLCHRVDSQCSNVLSSGDDMFAQRSFCVLLKDMRISWIYSLQFDLCRVFIYTCPPLKACWEVWGSSLVWPVTEAGKA